MKNEYQTEDLLKALDVLRNGKAFDEDHMKASGLRVEIFKLDGVPVMPPICVSAESLGKLREVLITDLITTLRTRRMLMNSSVNAITKAVGE